MDWMNNLFVLLTLTTITGSVFYLTGLVFGRIWARNDIRVLRIQMRITQWAFLLPCVYIVLYIRERERMMTTGGIINLFYNTPVMQKVFAAFGFVWIFSFMILFVRKIYMRCQRMRVFDGNIPEEDAETEAMFDDICAHLGIVGKVSLYRNDLIRMPYMTYWHGYAVVLPLEQYSREETAVILYHELCHYLNRDLYVGTVSCIVSLLHAINPLVTVMLRQLSLVCEEYCDRRACQEGAYVFSEKVYFGTILKVLSEEEKRERYDLFTLADSIGDYEKRVRCMKRYHEYGEIKKRTAVVLSVCFLLGSSAMALWIGKNIEKAYTIMVKETDIRIKADENVINFSDNIDVLSDDETLVEFEGVYDLLQSDVVIMEKDGIEMIGDFIGIDWSIEPGKIGMISVLPREEGGKITITTVGEPSDTRYQIGVRDQDDAMRYVEGTGTLQHDFLISKKGNYYFFVTNLDSTRELQIKGTVIK